jgi:hypothetical protein
MGNGRRRRGRWKMEKGICGGMRGIGFGGGLEVSEGRKHWLRCVERPRADVWETDCRRWMRGRFLQRRRTSHLLLLA